MNSIDIFCRPRRSFANALYLNKDRIPDERKKILQQELLKHYPTGTEITDELLLDAMNTETGYVRRFLFVLCAFLCSSRMVNGSVNFYVFQCHELRVH